MTRAQLDDALKSENIETISELCATHGDIAGGQSIDARQAAEFFEPDFVLCNPELEDLKNCKTFENVASNHIETIGDESSITVLNALGYLSENSRLEMVDKRQ